MKLAFILTFSILSTAASATCPTIGPAPRTINDSAAQYAASETFGIGEDGVLYYDYGTRYENLGKFRNPYFISNYANALYRDYLNTQCQDDGLLRSFLTQVEYLASSAERRVDMAVWAYPFPAAAFDLAPGWISGIGQARIAGVFERAFALTKREEFDDLARSAMTVFKVAPKDGGVATIDGDVTWFEEAADPEGHSYKILNGHITALTGILDIYQITGYPEWKELYDRGVAAVRRDIAEFDAGFTSYYSLASPGIRQMAARGDYNNLHVHQLLWLYERTGDGLFLEWASRFQAYESIDDTYSAKGAVDPVNHGPDQAAGFYGSHYWSHADFPTWLQVDTGAAEYFRGIAVHGGGELSAPRDYTVSARIDGEWQIIAKDRGNTDLRRVIDFTYPVLADAFRIDIDSDNGNRNVAIQAFMPIRQEPHFSPVTNDCNYPSLPSTEGPGSGSEIGPIKIACSGWIVIPMQDHGGIQVDAIAKDGAMFALEVSDDLRSWAPVVTFPNHASVVVPEARFARILFDNSVSMISRITLDLPLVGASEEIMQDRIP